MRPDARPSLLARYLLAAYVLLVVYGSLHRFTGWRDPGTSPFEYVLAPWPPYVTGFDLGANVIAYIPLGLLGVLTAAPRLVGASAWLAATLGGAVLSFTMEALQTYLPDRIASNVDLGANTLGAAFGAIAGVVTAKWLARHGGLYALRDELFHHGHQTDLGLVLIGLWLFALFNPETLLFGNGDLRDLFESLPATVHPAELFVRIEGTVTAANLVAVALLTGALMPSRRDPARRGVPDPLRGVRDTLPPGRHVRLADPWRTLGRRDRARAGTAGDVSLAPHRNRACRRAPHGGDGAGERGARESLSGEFSPGLATGPFPQLQRPDTARVDALAFRGTRLSPSRDAAPRDAAARRVCAIGPTRRAHALGMSSREGRECPS